MESQAPNFPGCFLDDLTLVKLLDPPICWQDLHQSNQCCIFTKCLRALTGRQTLISIIKGRRIEQLQDEVSWVLLTLEEPELITLYLQLKSVSFHGLRNKVTVPSPSSHWLTRCLIMEDDEESEPFQQDLQCIWSWVSGGPEKKICSSAARTGDQHLRK